MVTPVDTQLPAAPLPTGITDQELADAVDTLPPTLRVLWRLLSVLRDPDSNLVDIARLVRIDTALTTQVLKLANSPYYGVPHQVGSIEEAIQHIGVDEVSQLVSMLSSRELFTRALDHYGIEADLLWQHTIAVAVGAEAVARLFFTDSETAYLAGLLHPIGFVALDVLAPTRSAPAPAWSPSLLDRERLRFGADNAAIAERVLRYWEFPDDLAETVGRRYEIPTAATITQPGHELYLACHIAECAQVGLPVEAGLFPMAPEVFEEIGLRSEQFAELEFQVAERVTHLQALLEPV